MAGVHVRLEGDTAIAAALNPKALYAEPLRRGLDQAAQVVEREAQRRAPRLSGRTAAGIKRSVSGAAIPKYARVTVRGVTRKGFRYPFALDASRRRVYHYRSSGPVGAVTKDWFSGVREIAQAQVRAILGAVASEIEHLWPR